MPYTPASTDGDDLLLVNPGGLVPADVVDGRAGIDTLQLTAAGTLDITLPQTFVGIEALAGSSGNDVLVVNGPRLAGITSVSGGTGTDVLRVLAGSIDLYDIMLTGIETIQSATSASYALTLANLDQIQLLDGGGSSLFTALDLSAEVVGVTLNLSAPINGTVGATTIRGFAGGQILAGFGNDRLTGGASSDVLWGGAGRDDLEGRGGDDLLLGEAGLDLLTGGAGDDTLAGGDSADVLGGDEGNDRLDGGAGVDDLFGGSGDDFLIGGADTDRLFGDDGNDTMDAGSGFNTMSGGLGDDVYYVNDIANSPLENADEGRDTIISNLDSYSLPSHFEILRLGPTATTGSGIEGDELIVGNDGANVLYGADGNDTLEGGAGADRLLGERGIDFADYSNSSGVRVSLDGTVAATGEAQGDTFSGVENLRGSVTGSDYLRGNAGDNTLEGLGGDDGLDGGAGNDVLVGGAGRDGMLGGDGVDTANYASTNGVRVSLDGSLVATGDAVGDAFSRVEGLVGSATGNDHLRGNARNNTLEGLGGDDGLDGGAGNDILVGGAGSDGMLGGDGFDTASYTSSSGVRVSLDGSLVATGDAVGDGFSQVEGLNGSATGDDHLRGNAANNTLGGDGGNDSLEGGLGDDLLVGGTGNDMLDGGAGNDMFMFFGPPDTTGVDTILNYVVADDSIRLSRMNFTDIAQSGSFAASSAFVVGADAADANDRIIYNSATGGLFYDADGVGGAAQVQFAQLSAGLALTNQDFLIVT